ncbi:hypothetical protein [Paenibacillus sp. sgz500958]|uniref:hypothetical protein n=1 Tax=Paenibacillus sp. sgz500958 TaxID=3242475 RepID=UPI0036D2D6D2
MNKAQKAKNKGQHSPRGSMPSFGGGVKSVFDKMGEMQEPWDAGKRGKSKSGFPTPGRNNESSPAPVVPKRASSPYGSFSGDSPSSRLPDADSWSGEGVSLEQPWRSNLETRAEYIQQDMDRLRDGFGRSGGDEMKPSKAITTAVSPKPQPSSISPDLDVKQLRNGLIWAEILGPPRSRQPHHTSRRR